MHHPENKAFSLFLFEIYHDHFQAHIAALLRDKSTSPATEDDKPSAKHEASINYLISSICFIQISPRPPRHSFPAPPSPPSPPIPYPLPNEDTEHIFNAFATAHPVPSTSSLVLST